EPRSRARRDSRILARGRPRRSTSRPTTHVASVRTGGGMGHRAVAIELAAEERTELERRVRARTGSQQAALRGRIVLRAAAGAEHRSTARAEQVARRPVQLWRDRFAAERLAGLLDRPHRRPRLHGPAVEATIVLLARLSPTDLGVADTP